MDEFAEALDWARGVCLALPGAYEEDAWVGTRWMVRRRTFAYLLEMDPVVPDDQREGTIFYPFHGWEGQEVMGDHRRLIAELKAHESGPVTVCLYWNEHRVKAIRRLWPATPDQLRACAGP